MVRKRASSFSTMTTISEVPSEELEDFDPEKIMFVARSAFKFLDLPPELRLLIYFMVLVHRWSFGIFKPNRRELTWGGRSDRIRSTKISLLLVCKLIYQEALPILYSENVLTFGTKTISFANEHLRRCNLTGLRSFIRLVPKIDMASVKTVKLNFKLRNHLFHYRAVDYFLQMDNAPWYKKNIYEEEDSEIKDMLEVCRALVRKMPRIEKVTLIVDGKAQLTSMVPDNAVAFYKAFKILLRLPALKSIQIHHLGGYKLKPVLEKLLMEDANVSTKIRVMVDRFENGRFFTPEVDLSIAITDGFTAKSQIKKWEEEHDEY